MWDPAWDPRAERDTVEKLVKGIKTGVGNSAATLSAPSFNRGTRLLEGNMGKMGGWCR